MSDKPKMYRCETRKEFLNSLVGTDYEGEEEFDPTINYDDDIIKNLIGDNKISNSEETLNIFGSTKKEEDFLEVIEEYDNYEDTKEDIPDFDVIN